MQERNRLEGLDLMRAIAVVAVILFHFGYRGAHHDILRAAPAPLAAAKYGYLGVQLFFVISGFIIARSAAGRSPAAFALARFIRIYPAFLFCMTLTALATLSPMAGPPGVSLRQWAANLAIASPWLGQPHVDGVYWSLVYEVIFYGWIALALATGLFPRRLKLLIAAWLLVTAANGFIDSAVVRKLFLTDQSGFFAAGLALFEMARSRRVLPALPLLAAAVVVAVAQSLSGSRDVAALYGDGFDPRIVAALSVAAIGLVALSLAISAPGRARSALAVVGACTYPLYLLHQQLGYMLVNALSGAAPPWIAYGGPVLALAAASYAVFRFVEAPVQRRLRALAARRLGRTPPEALAGGTP